MDASSYKIVGEYLLDHDTVPLHKLAVGGDLWGRRVAMVSTLAFIRRNNLNICFEIAEILLDDKEDLIHKAFGWMLREAGKKDEKALKDFLKKHYEHMPRTALRYAIERFPEKVRKQYLQGEI